MRTITLFIIVSFFGIASAIAGKPLNTNLLKLEKELKKEILIAESEMDEDLFLDDEEDLFEDTEESADVSYGTEEEIEEVAEEIEPTPQPILAEPEEKPMKEETDLD